LWKIPVLRLNFNRLSAREIVRLSTGIFRKYPSQTWYICSKFWVTDDYWCQIWGKCQEMRQWTLFLLFIFNLLKFLRVTDMLIEELLNFFLLWHFFNIMSNFSYFMNAWSSPYFLCFLHSDKYYIVFYTNIWCLGGVFVKNTSRETQNYPSRKAREI
jgi:hypothetical protein